MNGGLQQCFLTTFGRRRGACFFIAATKTGTNAKPSDHSRIFGLVKSLLFTAKYACAEFTGTKRFQSDEFHHASNQNQRKSQALSSCSLFAVFTTLDFWWTTKQAPVNKSKKGCVSIDGVAARIYSLELFPAGR